MYFWIYFLKNPKSPKFYIYSWTSFLFTKNNQKIKIKNQKQKSVEFVGIGIDIDT